MTASRAKWYFLLPLLILLCSCGKSDISDLVSKVKKTANDATESAKKTVADKVGDAAGDMQETLKLAGKIELQMDTSLVSDACYVHFINPGGGRSAVLQMQSYRSADKETFPSVFLQTQVPANSVNELLGKVLSARIFVQPQENGPVWFSPHGGPVEVKVVSIDQEMFNAELVGGSLVSTEGGEINVAGSFQGVLDAVGS